ncbi:hypothetical protein N7520_002374 [Penicillium odoratum]|uniref:uncharacterized protein n=1 Tax=Penicillium odoratum TaxID=1167516 RepID=UPI0025491B8F|nr:uncharacterized protein N7520_002374 [Penicillium odoratum]KAJ5771845.1 hypothetical protein N7520_002374 [Penicillium odoratum]
MSGFEAAGLALAILPLLINQLDGYVQGIETLGDFRTKRYRGKLDYYATNLGSQQTIFINTLERSLESVIEYEDGVDSLGDDELKALWEKPSVQSLLQRKLGRSYMPFLRNMNQLSFLLKDLSRRLGWDKKPVAKAWEDSSTFNREVRKFKDIFSKNIYERIFKEINTANEQLAKLIEQSEYRCAVKKQRISKRPLQRLRQNRKHAKSLHNAIIKGNYWACSCRDQHTIYFILDKSSSETNTSSKSSLTPRFRMVVGSPQAAKYAGILANAHEIEAESDDFPSEPKVPEDKQATVQQVTVYPGDRSKNAKGSFALKDDCASVFSERSLPLSLISDMCLTLSKIVTKETELTKKEFLGCVADGCQWHYMYHLRKIAECGTAQSLTELLQSSSTVLQAQMNGSIFFSQKDRLSLAVNLAYSVLELHGNWLKPTWRARDIIFMRNLTSSIGHPTLVLSISSAKKTSKMCHEAATSGLIRNKVLFPLGLVLIELSLCQSLESLCIAEDYDDNEADANLKTASRLLQYVYSQSGPIYCDVVEQCLFWHWKTGYTLEDERIQDDVYQKIVFPLVENLSNFVGISQRP